MAATGGNPAIQVITSLDELDAKIAECNALVHQSDDALRELFRTFAMDFSAEAPADPSSAEYRDFQMALYCRIARKPYALGNERTLFNLSDYERPFPYYSRSCVTAGVHLMAIGFLLRMLDLPPGARVLEFGSGWGNSTMEMAKLGLQVTAVDIEPNFCELVRQRAVQERVSVEMVEADFFWAETVSEPYDAVVFFECFHHCDDHMRLLRALHRAVKPGGCVVFAAEPIAPDYPVPWGVRMDGEALWAIHNFGWLELGYRDDYFQQALATAGWTGTRHASGDMGWSGFWRAVKAEPPPEPPPVALNAAEIELAAVYRSTSWRVTAPLRWLRRAL